ncbi:ChbG/HpnK family deacetylase [Chloroflexia bacterium SDU3-3]|nr:ChbG/HpnK family deacetylase [Chloroflexia bacterium SDU3-3]
MPHPRQTSRMLGYPDDARLLIINADDFGMCHAVNEAVFRALQGGLLRSATLMVPCPWAAHAMQFLAAHPGVPFGIHLTAIAEWPHYRWGPLAPREKVPTLVDGAGRFPRFEEMPAFLAQVRLDQLELEWRAQIEAVLAAGLRPTHLDWHALRIGERADIADLLVRLARAYGLALRVRGRAWTEAVRALGLPCADYDFLDSYMMDLHDKPAQYERLLRELPEGLSEWAIHPGLHTPELLAIEGDTKHVRESDYDFLMSHAAREIVQEEGIILLDYRALQAAWGAR